MFKEDKYTKALRRDKMKTKFSQFFRLPLLSPFTIFE